MDKREALAIVVREAVREFLREEIPPQLGAIGGHAAPISRSRVSRKRGARRPRKPVSLGDVGVGPSEVSLAQPRFDFDPSSDAEFAARMTEAAAALSGGDPPADGELDELAQSDGGSLLRARRIAEREAQKQRKQSERLFPEDIEMHGLGPPQELP